MGRLSRSGGELAFQSAMRRVVIFSLLSVRSVARHRRVLARQASSSAVRRLDEYLRLLQADRFLFQFDDAAATGRLARRQVAVKGETLTVQSGRHQRQQQR